MDFDCELITLDKGETKNDDARSAPILKGNMRELCVAAKRECDAKWAQSPWVFIRALTRLAAGQGERSGKKQRVDNRKQRY
jgi:hypothetical protein